MKLKQANTLNASQIGKYKLSYRKHGRRDTVTQEVDG
jgi:hypothetical protein